MNDQQQLQQAKEQCIADLSGALPRYRERLDAADSRLALYIEDALSNHASHANLYELLGIRKVFRLMDSYDLDPERVQRTLRAIEGVWENGRHVKGGLKFDTPRGDMHVRLMPYQAWCVFGIYGFKVDVCMERTYCEGDELLPTEWVKDGIVWDTRRLTEEIHLFQTRKSGKTEFGAAVDFIEACFLGPVNAQILICSPSAEISQTAYKAIKEFAMQVDPSCMNRMGGKFFKMNAKGLKWQPGHRMKGEIKCMAAGKTPKDSLYGSVIHADEHGQPGYINGSCDMQNAVETCWGSTGPRREKLLMHTTTAGNVKDGPYKTKIEESVEPSLLSELAIPLDGQPHRTDEDSWFAFLLRLDPWEVTDDLSKLDDPELFKKVNRSIGTTVQPDYYRKRLHEAATSDDTKKEVLTKDFNLWQSDRFVKWLSGDQIRQRQIDKRIMDCWASQGWRVFCGLDFGGTDDIWAAGYLAVNYQQQQPEGRFFADMDLWITEKAMNDSPNRPLYEMWVRDGWLHVCPGEVFSHEMAVNQIMYRAGYNEKGELIVPPEQQIDISMFGYDPAQSNTPINQVKAWLQSLGIDAATIKKMVVPVSQSFVTMNGLVQEVEYALLTNPAWMQMSANPAWPWMFQNVKLEVSPNELKKPLKSSANNKVDGVHALLDGLYCFDFSEGNIQV